MMMCVAFTFLPYQGSKVKKIMQQEAPLDEKQKQILGDHYTLPRAALQGLSITSKQPMAILDEAPVEERLGPFARNHDGGALETEGIGVGSFPLFICNVNWEILPEMGQPFRKLQTFASEDGSIGTNWYHTLIYGSGVWYFELVAGLCRIDVQCDWTTGWRVCHRGLTAMACQMRPDMKMVVQVIGPEKWKGTLLDNRDLFTDDEVMDDV